MKSLEELVKEMPPEVKVVVRDFAESLIQKQKATGKGRKLSLSWAGGLAKYRDQYTSLELQKKALEWRKD